MKNHKKSLYFRTITLFLSFSVMTIILTVILQFALLPKIYEKTKRQNLDRTLTSVVSNISLTTNELQILCDDTAQYYGTCIIVKDGNNNIIANSQGNSNCILHRMTLTQLNDLQETAEKNGGSYLSRFAVDLPDKPQNIFGKESFLFGYSNRHLDSILKVTVVTSDSGDKKVIYVNSIISPVSDITQTNLILLLIVFSVMFFLSLILSVLYSRRFVRPVEEMNNEARKLMSGNFDVQFDTNSGSRELDELGDSLNKAAEELSKVDSLKTELLANVSHDLRTPLTLISGYSEMMRDLPGENNTENLNVIINESKRLTSLVNDVLDISKYQSGNIQISCAPFNLTELIRSTVSRMKKLDDQGRFEFRFYPREDVSINGDHSAIERVLYNLLLNAMNYSTKIPVIEIHQTVQDKNVKIEIIDHGSGISQEDLPYVFDRYYRSSESHIRSTVGSGLGLSIVKSILESHNAEFGVISSPGAGSNFWFSLPLC